MVQANCHHPLCFILALYYKHKLVFKQFLIQGVNFCNMFLRLTSTCHWNTCTFSWMHLNQVTLHQIVLISRSANLWNLSQCDAYSYVYIFNIFVPRQRFPLNAKGKTCNAKSARIHRTSTLKWQLSYQLWMKDVAEYC